MTRVLRLWLTFGWRSMGRFFASLIIGWLPWAGSVQAAEASESGAGRGAQEATESAGAEPSEAGFWAQFEDPDDGAFDISGWLGGGKGLLPVGLPISEPAVGIGVAAAIAYFHPQPEDAEQDASVPPSISFLGGAWTDNGTRAGALGHLGVWKNGRIRYIGAVISADVNLTFFEEGGGEEDGLTWNARAAGTIHQIKFAVRDRLFLGGQYFFASTDSRLGTDLPLFDEQLESDLAGLGLVATYDSRNTTFTPSKGLFANLALVVHDEILGSDFDYPRVDLDAFRYFDLDRLVLGLRFDGSATGSGAPFYGLPYLRMRGVPAFRYVGRHSVLAEIEPMWRVTPRWGWVGFLAAGQAIFDSDEAGDEEVILAGGTGFRYMIARKQRLAVGIDVGWGPEDTAVYFVIGSYWGGR